MNAFIESQFSHCRLVWMFCWTREHNNRINRIQERGLRAVYDDYTSSFEDLLKKNGSVTIHHRNIQRVAIEMFKVKYGHSNELISCLFEVNLGQNDRTFIIPRVNTEYMGKHSLRYFGPVVWENMLPGKYKEITNLSRFKTDIKRFFFTQMTNILNKVHSNYIEPYITDILFTLCTKSQLLTACLSLPILFHDPFPYSQYSLPLQSFLFSLTRSPIPTALPSLCISLWMMEPFQIQ